MTNENEDRMHEKLCAYVLLEGTPEERAEVEAALAQSEELRAECDRIEATIGLVRGALGDAETLSSQATAEILSAAGPRKGILWHRVVPRAMAAGIGIAIAGFGIYALSKVTSYDEPRGIPEQASDERAAGEKDGEKKNDYVAMVSKNELSNAPKVQGPQGSGSVADASSGTVFKQQAEAFAGLGYGSKDGSIHDGADTATFDWKVGEHFGEQPHPEPMSRNEAVVRLTPPVPAAPMLEAELGSGRAKDPAAGSRDLGLLVNNGPSSASSPSTGGIPPVDAQPGLAFGVSKALAEGLSGLGYVGEEATGGSDHFAPVAGARDRLRELGYVSESSDRPSGRMGLALTPEQREHYLDEECRRIFTGCYRRPHERPRDMFFRFWGDNPLEVAALDAQSTFSVDVDTASYALARRYLSEGNMPTKAQVRTEEFVNYFKADVQAPREGTFAIHTDLAPSRFSADAQRWMLRVVVRGREVAKTERKPLALTFVIDVSGSMREQNRLEMVKHTLRLLLSQLDANDSIAMVAFSNEARMILPMTSAGNRGLIESAMFPLQPTGSTNSQAGLKMGYEAALAGLNPNATNRVVFLSDGVANVGVTDPNEITNEVQRIREKGIYLNTVGVGMNNHNDVLLEQLADKGDGVCNYVDTAEEAKRVMVDGFTGAFEPIARDVKVQIEFDPAQVARYRLLGYENRAIADKDFRNDKADAGEIGAGHQVTALYEIERTGAGAEKPLATVRLRWKAPRQAGPNADAETEQATEIEQGVLAAQATSFEGAGAGYRRAVIVAQFAELLRRSQHARGESLDDLIAEASKLEREVQDKDFTELSMLMQKSKALILASRPACDELCETIDLVRRNQILRAENELLAKDQDAKLVDELERQNRELEQRIRDLLRRRLETR